MASDIVQRLRNLNPWGEPGWPEDIKEAAGHIETLQRRVEELEAGLKLSFRAINDWVVVYASDMCDDARVEETKLRIRDAGGTLAYVAEINSVLGPLLRALKSDPAPVPAPKPFTFADPNAQLQHERHRAESKRREGE